MAQHDYNIENQPGASLRADLNNLLPAIVTNNAGLTAPNPTYPHMWWADENSGILKQRNAANDGWINKGLLSSAFLNASLNFDDVPDKAAAFNTIKQLATVDSPGAVEAATEQETLAGVENKFPDAKNVLAAIANNGVAFTFNKQTRDQRLFELDGTTLQTAQTAFIWVNGVVVALDAGEAVTLPTLASHTDYKIWLADNGGLSAQPWDDADPADSRWIGGFHAYHTDATINPQSIWDLGYRPKCNPRAMAQSPDGVWFDIYLMDTAYGINGYSRGDVTIADDSNSPIIPAIYGGNGSTTYGNMTWFVSNDLAISAGKRLMFYGEFTGAAYGVVERSARGTDPVTTKKDTDFRSAIGLEQVTGCMYQWGADIAATAGTAWTNIAANRGDVFASNIKAVLLGAHWTNGSNAGSRASRWDLAPDASSAVIGSRAACDHLFL